MSPKDADGMANSVDPDQTAPREEQSDLGLHCLPRPICPKIRIITVPEKAGTAWVSTVK